MKKLFLAVLLAASTLSFAQEEQERKERKEKLTIEQQTELRVKKMTLDLDLNDSQKKEIKTLLLEQSKKRESKMAEMKNHKEKGEKPTAEERFAMKSKMLDEQIGMKNKMKKILTSDQMKKWEEAKENHPKRTHRKERKQKSNK